MSLYSDTTFTIFSWRVPWHLDRDYHLTDPYESSLTLYSRVLTVISHVYILPDISPTLYTWTVLNWSELQRERHPNSQGSNIPWQPLKTLKTLYYQFVNFGVLTRKKYYSTLGSLIRQSVHQNPLFFTCIKWFETNFGSELWRHSDVSEDCVAVFTHQIQSAHSKRRLDKRTHLFAKFYFKIRFLIDFCRIFSSLNFTNHYTSYFAY